MLLTRACNKVNSDVCDVAMRACIIKHVKHLMFVAFDQMSSLDWTDSPVEMVVTPIYAHRPEVLVWETAVVDLESKGEQKRKKSTHVLQ